MAVVLLISPEEFKDATPVNGNVDEKMMRQSILACQDIFVQNIVGSGIYNQIKDQVENSNLSADNTILLNTYLQPAMRYWIMAEILAPMTFRFQNVGGQTKRTEVTNPITSKDITELENRYRNRAEWYAQRTALFLCENSNTYPLYDNAGSGVDTIFPKHNNYTTSIFLGDAKVKKTDRYGEPM